MSLYGIGHRPQPLAAAAGTQLVYDFSEGSRELLGGKGATVAGMSRVLGAERAPEGTRLRMPVAPIGAFGVGWAGAEVAGPQWGFST